MGRQPPPSDAQLRESTQLTISRGLLEEPFMLGLGVRFGHVCDAPAAVRAVPCRTRGWGLAGLSPELLSTREPAEARGATKPFVPQTRTRATSAAADSYPKATLSSAR